MPYSVFVTTASGDSAAPTVKGSVNPTGTVYSKMWSGRNTDGYGLTISWTGTLSGTLTLWMTDKENPSEADDTDWVQDTGFSPTNPAGTPDKFRDDASNARAFRKRLKYVHTTGTGTLYAYVSTPRMR